MVAAFRLTKRNRASNAFDGEGSRLYGGRWNSKGVRMVYTSQSLSLAILETLVHLDSESILASQFVYRTAIFKESFCQHMDRSSLPESWDSDELTTATQKLGDQWVKEGQSAVLAVPSVLSPEETNYLFNPEHPDFQHVKLGPAKTFRFSPRLKR